ncbi:DinB family protein [Shimia sp. R9_3]|uniref:DinB family protein n=1 Tax=Shimia sp. R9_3 TaxID=2821113 RepID=UPI001ADC3FD1|nr:DinB family protein [Shimia sp. R9_3]MBO9401544.1 DinB family protein [Shimia sp. R9_3]
MISPAYCQMMARYNAWQNSQLRSVCDTLSDAELREDRGAFFGSIMATLNHILWGDTLWISRLDGGAGPKVPAKQHAELCATYALWSEERLAVDRRIAAWAEALRAEELEGDLKWHAQMLNADMQKPVAQCVVQLFNHQTHHRGQIHAMLTSIGHDPGDTDVALLPEGATWL